MGEELGLSGLITGLGHRPHGEILRLLKNADLLLAINYEGWSTLIPAKIYEYWAVGGPPILLLSCPGAASSFVEHNHLGFTADPSDVTTIQQVLMTVYHQWKSGVPMHISSIGIEAYDRNALTYELAQLLSIVV